MLYRSEDVIRKSDYLLTILFNTKYFKKINPVTIVAYLIPFVDGNGCPYGTTLSEMRRKEDNIADNLHGNYKNFASQGFTPRWLYQPYVNFPYYYEQLTHLSSYVKNSYKGDISIDSIYTDLESDYLYSILMSILKKHTLYFKRECEISEEDKQILMHHLKTYGNQYVLAELLYYITSHSHRLPYVEEQFLVSIKGSLSDNLLCNFNVAAHLRRKFNEEADDIAKKFSQVCEFKLMCFSGTSFLDSTGISDCQSYFQILVDRLSREEKIDIKIILTNPESLANKENSKYRSAPYHSYISKADLSKNSIVGIKQLMNISPSRVHAKTTAIFMPYCISIFYFTDKKLNFAKVDIYSPYVKNNEERPSMVIFQVIEPELFRHFENTFLNVWNDDEVSEFL